MNKINSAEFLINSFVEDSDIILNLLITESYIKLS